MVTYGKRPIIPTVLTDTADSKQATKVQKEVERLKVILI